MLKGKGKGKVFAPNSNPMKEVSDIPSMNDPKESIFYYFEQKGHLKHSYPKHLEDPKKKKEKGARNLGMFTFDQYF